MSDNWNDDWRNELEEKNANCHLRLCECRNTQHDIAIMAKLMYKYNQWATPEDCLDRMIEWVCYWNNQDNLDPDDKEYDTMLKYINGK